MTKQSVQIHSEHGLMHTPPVGDFCVAEGGLEYPNVISRREGGFTLMDILVSVTVFTILVAGVIGAVSALHRSVKAAREQTILSSLVSSDLEIVRNLPYVQVGTVQGNPPGALPDQASPRSITVEGRTYAIYYEVTYTDDPADGTALAGTDSSAADYKQVKMFIRNTTSGQVTTILTTVSPKGLEGTQNAGALSIRVLNAQGQPVSGARVQIFNTVLNPDITLDRTTDASGNWIEVGLPPSVNGYHVVVSKNGYSTDQTYPLTAQNPNPIKPDATVLVGQVTQVTFAIDLLANLTIRTLDQKCQPVNGIGVNVAGSKLIGTNPNILKFNTNYTSASGQIALQNIEWDTYTPTLLAGQNVMVYGTSPIQRIDVLPGTTQTFTLLLGAYSANSLLVIVKDAATGAALEGADVHVQKGGSVPQDYYGITGGSILTQVDWTGGGGQQNFVNDTQYADDSGTVDANSVPTGLRLEKTAGDYATAGWLESSTFDTGTDATNFTTLTFAPLAQDPATTLRFQVAANNDNTTWDYTGPDGTNGTYYTVSGTNLHTSLDGNRYVRYKVFLSTTDVKRTPVLTSVGLNYVSGCFSPGQSMFSNLTSGNNYTIEVSMAGYQTYTASSASVSGNQILEVLLSR